MTDSPNDVLNESISALVDGEANDLDLQRVLKAMENAKARVPEGDGDVRATWSRYQSISAVMSGQGSQDVPTGAPIDRNIDLSLAISERIKQEKIPGSGSKWLRNVGKIAVAASVTFGVVMGGQQYLAMEDGGAQEIANVAADADVTGSVVPQGFDLPPLSARTVSTASIANKYESAPVKVVPQSRIVISSDEFQDQINRLMFKHAEQSSSAGGLGVIPFARVSELDEEGKGQ